MTDDAVRTGAAERRRAVLVLGSFLAWTAFVWLGRVRNAFGDPDLTPGERTGPLLLAASFLVPSVVVLVGLVRSVRAGRPLERWASTSLRTLAVWTAVLWIVRAADIAIGGDHDLGFVVVHLVLALVSIALGVGAVVSDHRARIASRGVPVTTSHQNMA